MFDYVSASICISVYNISTQFSSLWPIERTLSGATTPEQCGPGSDSSEGVLHIPQSFSITGTAPWDFLVSYLGHSFGSVLPLSRNTVGVFFSSCRLGHRTHAVGNYSSAEKQLVYFSAPTDWTTGKSLQVLVIVLRSTKPSLFATHSAGAVEYTNCIPTVG